MVKRTLTVLVVLVAAIAVTGVAQAHDPEDIDSGQDINEFLLHASQHGPLTGHLPPTQRNVDLVSKLELTTLESGIADVGYFKGYAYLNAWAPNCPNGGGVHVVDVRDPANPQAVGFIPAKPNEYPGEGIHVMSVDTPFFTGDLLLHNNETCNSATPSTLGMSLWDVTDPLNPVKLNQFGDADPPPVLFSTGTYHSIHSVQGFTQPGKAFAVMIDNEEGVVSPFKDVDIVDITNPAAPRIVAEVGLDEWPDAQSPLANGDTVFFHDVQFKRIGGHDFLALSYWDAGQILLNVDDPSNPVFVGDSDYLSPDPETGFEISEGNSHEAYWSSNNKFLLSTDEDFSPMRTLFQLTTGPNAGPTAPASSGGPPRFRLNQAR